MAKEKDPRRVRGGLKAKETMGRIHYLIMQRKGVIAAAKAHLAKPSHLRAVRAYYYVRKEQDDAIRTIAADLDIPISRIVQEAIDLWLGNLNEQEEDDGGI